MNIINQEIIIVDYNALVREFEKQTGWSSTVLGIWNADFTKTVFDIELVEVFQREQDWMAFVYPDNTETQKKNKEFLFDEDNSVIYKEHVVHNLYLVDIVTWMVLNGHLPDSGEFLVTCK